MLSALTSRLDDAGTPLADPPAKRLPVGRNTHRSPLLRSAWRPIPGRPRRIALSIADAFRQFPSVMFPRFGPVGGLAMTSP